jgi:mono/diheme cytochrome c family protein
MPSTANGGRRSWRAALIVLLLLLTVPVSVALAADPTSGQTLFQANCVTCHGKDAAGGNKVGDATAPDIRWTAIGDQFKNDPVLLRRAILNGKDEDGNDLDDAMPNFEGKLTNAQADDIVAYLQTLKGPTPLPKSGDLLGLLTLPWIALAGVVLALGGFLLRRVSIRQA